MPKPIDMPEMIDKKALLEILCFGCTKDRDGICRNEHGRCAEYTIIKLMPTIEPEVRHGRWIVEDDCERFIARCSECGRSEDSRMIAEMPYCHCGARMDLRTPTEVQLDEADSVMIGEIAE